MSRIHVVLLTFFALFTSGGARGLSQGSTSGFEVTESSHLYSTTEQPQYAKILGIYPEKPLERREGTAVHLQCLVHYKSELAHCHVEVSWERTRGPETEMERLSTNGVLHAPWRRNSNFKAEVSKQDGMVQEHSIFIANVNITGDSGRYLCVMRIRGPEMTLVNTKQTVVNVVPRPSDAEYFAPYEGGEDVEYEEYVPKPKTAPLKVRTASSSRSQKVEADDILGPSDIQYVIAKKGMDVILECRDGDKVEQRSVQWKRHRGGHGDTQTLANGRKLKLIKMDSWDSGIYYCTTVNTSSSSSTVSESGAVELGSGSSSRNLELNFREVPKITFAPSSKSESVHLWNEDVVVYHDVGEDVTISCEVESPKEPAFINWYREVTVPFEEDEAESPLATSRNYKNHQHRRHRIYYEECRQNTGTGNQKKVLKPIRMSDEYQTTMTMLGPGITKASLQISHFDMGHYGKYVCKAVNTQGESSLAIRLENPAKKPVLQNVNNNNHKSVPRQSSASGHVSPGIILSVVLVMISCLINV